MSFLMNHLILKNPILNSENDGILMAQVHKRVSVFHTLIERKTKARFLSTH